MLAKEKTSKKYTSAAECPITATIDIIGGKWKPIIIWLLIAGTKRFGELHKSIPGIALKVLSRQLKELEADGIIKRKAYGEVPPRVEYALSKKGKTLQGIMESLADWSRNNITGGRDTGNQVYI